MQNAPTQSLMNVIYGILDESIERKNAEIPQVQWDLLFRLAYNLSLSFVYV